MTEPLDLDAMFEAGGWRKWRGNGRSSSTKGRAYHHVGAQGRSACGYAGPWSKRTQAGSMGRRCKICAKIVEPPASPRSRAREAKHHD